jgi:hypothetical protein
MGAVDELSPGAQLRQSSGNSSASSGSLAGLSDTDTVNTLPGPTQGFIIALHRKMVSYFYIMLLSDSAYTSLFLSGSRFSHGITEGLSFLRCYTELLGEWFVEF